MTFFLFDDGAFDYTGLVEPKSQKSMVGYHATAWNTDLSYTGRYKGMNVVGITTNDKLFDMSKGDISQAVQIQKVWNPHDVLPWLWEKDQGIYDKLTIEYQTAVHISWGNNLQQVNSLLRFEDVSKLQAGTDHGQRLWIQCISFDNKYQNRPMEIYRDPYTNFEDIVVNVPIIKGTHTDMFDFSKSANITGKAHSDLRDIEITIARWQFNNILAKVEKVLGVDLQNEAGYWSLIQAGATNEMASFPIGQSKWGIGHEGAMQVQYENLMVYDN